MAIGDLGASFGLTVYPDTQDVALGYQNSNQRADDIAVQIRRITVQNSTPSGSGHVTGDIWIQSA